MIFPGKEEMMNIDKKKILKTLEALSDALGNSEGQSIEEIREDLDLTYELIRVIRKRTDLQGQPNQSKASRK